MCVLKGKPITIGTEISREYVRYAEEIADISYSQAETFSSALLHPSAGPTYSIGKPKLPVHVKVIQALIRSAGKVVNVRTIVKNIRDKATEIIKGSNIMSIIPLLMCTIFNTNALPNFSFTDELLKLSEQNYGQYVDKDQMARDKVLPTRNCFCAFVKRDIRSLADDFFLTVRDRDCTRDMYTVNYDKPIDDNMKKVAMKYARDKDISLIAPLQTNSGSKYNIIFLGNNLKYSATIFTINIRYLYSVAIFQMKCTTDV